MRTLLAILCIVIATLFGLALIVFVIEGCTSDVVNKNELSMRENNYQFRNRSSMERRIENIETDQEKRNYWINLSILLAGTALPVFILRKYLTNPAGENIKRARPLRPRNIPSKKPTPPKP